MEPIECPVCVRKCAKLHKHNKVQCCRKCYRKLTGAHTRKEKVMSDYLDEKFGTEYLHCSDRIIGGAACTKYRPDKLYTSPHVVLQVECDEHQHRGQNYSCEQRRISEISEEFPGKKLLVIRWNPDAYKAGKVGRAERHERLRKLVMTMNEKLKNHESLPMISVVYLYYDADNPNITRDLPKEFVY